MIKEEYFETEEGLKQLLLDNKDVFDMIDDYGKRFLGNVLSTSEDYKEALTKLTGAYIILEPLYTIACAYKRNDELKAYVTGKNKLEASGNKVVATHLEKESSLAVEHIRRVRNLCEGYVEACNKAIITCQTQLRRIEENNKYKNEE